MRRKILPFILGGALAVATVAPVGAAHNAQHIVQRGGAAGLVAAVVQVAATVNVENVNIANNSLNNLLRNADIDVLNNVLNNNTILSNIDIEITRVLNNNNVVVTVLSGGVSTGTITITPTS